MPSGRTVLLAVAGLIVLVTAATATPLWTVPEKGAGQAPLGDGSATVEVLTAPETATLEPGRQGGGVYYLRVPDAKVEVTNLRGNPVLTYTIDIDELGYSRSSVTGLASVGEGTVSFTIQQDSMYGREFDKQRYEGELRLVLRGDGTEQVVYEKPIVVEVTE